VSDLSVWLRRQILDDVELARADLADYDEVRQPVMESLYQERWHPDRVIADLDAKFRTCDMADAEDQSGCCGTVPAGMRIPKVVLHDVLRELAMAYRDRDGYRPEWRLVDMFTGKEL
jgi:hypothetical protein